METTIFPLQTLPACATACGPLFDVNGACVPPAAPTADAGVYDRCFCGDARLTAFSTATAGVCDNACTATPADLGSIQNWYSSFCGSVQAAAGNTAKTSSTSTATAAANNSGGGGTWIDNHYQWVIFLVIMVVAIVGIWIGACIWRRRYLRKKDRAYALGTNLARTTGSGRVVPNAGDSGSVHVPQAGMFEPAPLSSAGVYVEKPPKAKKKWIVRERT